MTVRQQTQTRSTFSPRRIRQRDTRALLRSNPRTVAAVVRRLDHLAERRIPIGALRDRDLLDPSSVRCVGSLGFLGMDRKGRRFVSVWATCPIAIWEAMHEEQRHPQWVEAGECKHSACRSTAHTRRHYRTLDEIPEHQITLADRVTNGSVDQLRDTERFVVMRSTAVAGPKLSTESACYTVRRA